MAPAVASGEKKKKKKMQVMSSTKSCHPLL